MVISSPVNSPQPRPLRQNWQTPRADGERLLVPPPADWLGVANRNAVQLSESVSQLHGRSLHELAMQARNELLTAATNYTRSYREVRVPAIENISQSLFLMAGHQPELFHPGVWLKNSLLHQISSIANSQPITAQQLAVVAINLVIDTDLVKSAAVNVPAGTSDQPHWEAVELDGGVASVPWEDRRVASLDQLSTWPERMSRVALSQAQQGCWREYWPLLVARAEATNNLGLAMAQARHQLEARWGWQTLEVPISTVTALPAVRWFLFSLLHDAERFQQSYNYAIEAYRAKNHITSSAHPAPLLEKTAEWVEVPFWIWHKDNPRRARAWMQRRKNTIIISDRASIELEFPISNAECPKGACAAWTEYESQGYRLRTRALVTTMVSRVLLSDLFVHGLGGAKYDEVTDQLIHDYLRIDSPQFAVVSGTLLWPATKPNSEQNVSSAKIVQQIRATRYHPEQFLVTNNDKSIHDIISQKRTWLLTPKTADNARARHQAITAANSALQESVADKRRELQNTLTETTKAERANGITHSRDLAFVLHSQERLLDFFRFSF